MQGKFLYTKFFAVGLFRLVELTGAGRRRRAARHACSCERGRAEGQATVARRRWPPPPVGTSTLSPTPPPCPTTPPPRPAGSKDPKTLTGLVKALGLSQERVNADLMTYKGVLSKLESAKEIMKVRAWVGVGGQPRQPCVFR